MQILKHSVSGFQSIPGLISYYHYILLNMFIPQLNIQLAETCTCVEDIDISLAFQG